MKAKIKPKTKTQTQLSKEEIKGILEKIEDSYFIETKPQKQEKENEGIERTYYVKREKRNNSVTKETEELNRKVEKRFLSKEKIKEMRRKGKEESERKRLEKVIKNYFGVNKKEFLGILGIEGIKEKKLKDLVFNELVGIKREYKGIEKIEAKIRDIVFNGRKYWGRKQEAFDKAIKKLGEYIIAFDRRYLEVIFKRGKQKLSHSSRNILNRLLRNSKTVVEAIDPSAYYNKKYYIKGNEPEFLTPNKYKLIRDLADIPIREEKKEKEGLSEWEKEIKKKEREIKKRREKQTERERRKQILLYIRGANEKAE